MAEGGALLRRYTGKTRIEGSNPSHSASSLANYARGRAPDVWATVSNANDWAQRPFGRAMPQNGRSR